MHKKDKTVLVSKASNFFGLLLLFFPGPYRKKFGQEMLYTFEDLYQEKMASDGTTGLVFWINIIVDMLKSSIEQHSNLMKKQGMKKYFFKTVRISWFNIIGGILLLPFFTVFVIDIASRFLQGDLVHYNRPVYHYLAQTVFYQKNILFIWVFLFPILAVFINFIPIMKNIVTNKTIFKSSFYIHNALSLALIIIAGGFLAIIVLHDLVPCVLHAILNRGITQLPRIISVCRDA